MKNEQCVGKRKEKSKTRSIKSEDGEVHSQVNKNKTSRTKRKKQYPEETPVCVPVSKPRKRPTESDTSENEKKTKRRRVEENAVKKQKRRRKKSLEQEEAREDEPVSSGGVQGEGDEDGGEGLSPEERRVLERKMKKKRKKEEKRRAREGGKDAVTAEAPSAAQRALDYLSCWWERRAEWRFQKTRQTWLLQHMFDAEKVPDQSFNTLLLYLEGLRGVARDTSVQKAEALLRQLEGGGAEEQEALLRGHRAKEVIQILA
ncbi:hypothetical protein GJAV_G00260130 [Gymnothorax javanicus]|nr:hypothetical protein GJAV_G00260130 [Gymnothorax javanicus]